MINTMQSKKFTGEIEILEVCFYVMRNCTDITKKAK